jgi:hypothetical protein
MEEPIIVNGFEPPPILGRTGRPKGAGCNLRLLAKLTPGDTRSCVWGCSQRKMNSIRTSAIQHGIKVKIRRLEDGTYAIWRT